MIGVWALWLVYGIGSGLQLGLLSRLGLGLGLVKS